MSLAPGQQIGDYLILQELGAGGMGKVYKVQNVISDRLEAMKVLLPDLTRDSDLADRFLREIKVQASLEHPNIARLHTAMRADNQLLMLMEFVEGRTVESLFTPERPMPLDHAVWYCMQVLSALDYAHVRGIVHRDIKPSNMMLTNQGQIKLLDFGIARVINDPSLTQTRQTVGSLFYMSPEQINGQPVDARSDLYSLGVSLYQMVTGRKPFDGTSDFSIMAAHMQQQAIPPMQLDPSMPQSLNDAILRAIAKDVNNRFQSAAEFHAGLEGVLRVIQSGGQPAAPVAAPQPQPTPMPPPTSGSGLGLKLGIVALVVFLLAGGGLAWWKLRKPVAEPEPTVAVTPPAPETKPETKVDKQPEPPAQTPPQVETKPAEPVAVAAAPVNKPTLPVVKPEAKTTAPQTAPPPVRVTTPEPVVPAPVAVTPPATTTPAPAAQPAAPRLHAAVVSELRVRRVRIQSRLEACKAAMNNLRDTLASQGLKPRGDIGILLQTVASEVSEAEAAVKDADAEAARQHFDIAEQALRKAERFFNL
jgi:eukaryotic-like serine/threonine-protein kinase